MLKFEHPQYKQKDVSSPSLEGLLRFWKRIYKKLCCILIKYLEATDGCTHINFLFGAHTCRLPVGISHMPILWKENVSLKPYTTFKTGGTATWFVEVTKSEDLVEIFNDHRTHTFPRYILAGGSNLLIEDNLSPCIVIYIKNKGYVYTEETDHILLTAQAGENWDDVVKDSVSKGYAGLELLSWIPGTVGAAPVQNIGAYGTELSHIFHSATYFDSVTKTFQTIQAEDCNFAYRTSCFKNIHKDKIITEVTLKLSKTWTKPRTLYPDLITYEEKYRALNTIEDIRNAVISIRTDKLPDLKVYGTAGSFFKHPIITVSTYQEILKIYPAMPSYPYTDTAVKIPAGWLIDHVAGMKGHIEGNVGTYAKQALILINTGKATSTEIYQFGTKIQGIIKEKTGISLEMEVVRFI